MKVRLQRLVNDAKTTLRELARIHRGLSDVRRAIFLALGTYGVLLILSGSIFWAAWNAMAYGVSESIPRLSFMGAAVIVSFALFLRYMVASSFSTKAPLFIGRLGPMTITVAGELPGIIMTLFWLVLFSLISASL